MRKYRLLKVLKIVTVVAVGVTVFGVVVERLWNWLVPTVFGWKSITFPQALGLLALCKILFGGFHRHGGGRGWKHRIEERWARMSPEERERIRAGLQSGHRSGWNPAHEPSHEETAKQL